jgi:hypothetical protein
MRIIEFRHRQEQHNIMLQILPEAQINGSVRRGRPERAKRSNRSGSEKPVQDSERYSSPMRFGSDPRITIPASGF